jgi:hypothetical protein
MTVQLWLHRPVLAPFTPGRDAARSIPSTMIAHGQALGAPRSFAEPELAWNVVGLRVLGGVSLGGHSLVTSVMAARVRRIRP